MNHDHIRSFLAEAGYDAELTADDSRLMLEFEVGERRISLVHDFPNELLRVPKFHLADGYVGKLAHVGVSRNGEPSEVCIADAESTAVNTDCPELVYLETVQKHVTLLTRLIENPAYNRAEQLREFEAHWEILCDEAGEKTNEIFVAWDGDKVERLQVKLPSANSGRDLRTRPIALAGVLATDPRLVSVRDSAGWRMRQIVGKAVAAPLNDLDPAPTTQDDLLGWYFRVVDRMDSTDRRELKRLHRKKSREYWLVFSAPIPDGETMFALHWNTRTPGGLPASSTQAKDERWTVTPYRVRSLSHASLVPRGGGSLDLRSKSVLLVGCGSVGSELAIRLTSTGVGHLTLSDPDKLSEENLYRHTLSVNDIGRFKTPALTEEITLRHPWAEVTYWRKRLEDLREPAELREFDLIVIAIGSPNVERLFAEYCNKESINVPVINCWLEGYGIGGHAIIAIPRTKGCWHCAYVNPQTLTRGLTSNLNFLAPNQTVMRNHGGCGAQFLPYSGIAAGYTASISADLAVRFLQGQVTNSSKVSWKGSDVEAQRASLAVTRRYRHFTESLHILPLHDKNCDLCGG